MSLHISASGMADAMQRQDLTARRVARLNTSGESVDLAREQVNTIINRGAVQANAGVFRAQDDALGTLLDISR